MRRALALAAGLAAFAPPADAVIILDSTWREEGGRRGREADGFGAHIALANRPPFDGVIAFSSDGDTWGDCSGTWIGNDGGVAYVLTSAHCFADAGSKASMYIYRSRDGSIYEGLEVIFHPSWPGGSVGSTGADAAIVVLDGEIVDAGPAPLLYGGTQEKGRTVTFVGYGSRGIGSRGEQDVFYEWLDVYEQKAAAEGVIDVVVGPDADPGNYFVVFLPKEDGSIPNPYGGSNRPVSRLAGLLGSGDSGGSAWIQLQGGRWAIAGINSNGTGNAGYGESAWFGRVSADRDWILSVYPGARFVTD